MTATRFKAIELHQLSDANGGAYVYDGWTPDPSMVDSWGTGENSIWVANETGYTEVSCPAGTDLVLNPDRTDALDVTCSPTPDAADYDGYGPTADNYGAFGEAPTGTETVEVAPDAPSSIDDAQPVDPSGVEVQRDGIYYYGDNGESSFSQCGPGTETGADPDTGEVGCIAPSDYGELSPTDTSYGAFGEAPTGAVETGAVDTGSFDAGSFDAGSFDAGSFDAGSFDAGSFDAGSFNAGGFDGGGGGGGFAFDLTNLQQ